MSHLFLYTDSYALAKLNLNAVRAASDLSSFESSSKKKPTEPPKLPPHPSTSANATTTSLEGNDELLSLVASASNPVSLEDLGYLADFGRANQVDSPSHSLGLLNVNFLTSDEQHGGAGRTYETGNNREQGNVDNSGSAQHLQFYKCKIELKYILKTVICFLCFSFSGGPAFKVGGN